MRITPRPRLHALLLTAAVLALSGCGASAAHAQRHEGGGSGGGRAVVAPGGATLRVLGLTPRYGARFASFSRGGIGSLHGKGLPPRRGRRIVVAPPHRGRLLVMPEVGGTSRLRGDRASPLLGLGAVPLRAERIPPLTNGSAPPLQRGKSFVAPEIWSRDSGVWHRHDGWPAAEIWRRGSDGTWRRG